MRVIRLLLVLLCAVPLWAASVDGYWTGAVEGDWRVTMAVRTSGGSAGASVDFPDVGGYARAFDGTFEETGSAPRLQLRRPQPNGTAIEFDLTLAGDQLRGTFRGLGHTAPIALRRATAPAPPAVREEAVRFRNGEVELAGTLFFPAGTGRVPLVVFTHGSGPESRQPNGSLALYLAGRGIASLVYDKRGVGESTGEWESASMRDLAMDAVVGARLASMHPRVRSVGIFGHSQGGWIAPLAATLEPTIRFVIAGGLASVDPMAQTIFHRAGIMRKEGFDAEAIARGVGLWRRLYAAPKRGPERETARAAILAARTEPWFEASGLPPETMEDVPDSVQEFMTFDPIPVWQQVTVPVLAFWGTADDVVPFAASRAAISKALQKNGDVTLRYYEGMQHNQLVAGEGLPRIPRALHADLGDWVLLKT